VESAGVALCDAKRRVNQPGGGCGLDRQQDMSVSVLLCNPKYAHNVAASLRVCALLGADRLYWTGDRVPNPDAWPEGARLPREERMKLYRTVHLEWLNLARPITYLCPAYADPSHPSLRQLISTP